MVFKPRGYHKNTKAEVLLEDLKKVAQFLQKNTLTKNEYELHGKYSLTAVHARFGSWNKALVSANLEITLSKFITELELLKNLESVWMALGRQPKAFEIKKPLSKYGMDTYRNRFGSWRKALERYNEYINAKSDIPKAVQKSKERSAKNN